MSIQTLTKFQRTRLRSLLLYSFVILYVTENFSFAQPGIPYADEYASRHLKSPLVDFDFMLAINGGEGSPSGPIAAKEEIDGSTQFLTLFYNNIENGLVLFVDREIQEVGYGKSFNTETQRLDFGMSYRVTPMWRFGVKLEIYESAVKNLRSKDKLSYDQPTAFVSYDDLTYGFAYALAPKWPAQYEVKTLPTGNIDRFDAEVSTSHILSGWWRPNLIDDFSYWISFDSADAISNEDDKPNQTLRKKVRLSYGLMVDDYFYFQTGLLHNRSLFSIQGLFNRHPQQSLYLAGTLFLSKKAQISSGFETDFGGLLNPSDKKERIIHLVFGFSYETN